MDSASWSAISFPTSPADPLNDPVLVTLRVTLGLRNVPLR
jgi:hypothetical protein